tara:strand:- start:130 stop:822 length:693 start_codon:yes stop_codon:yes gene_type:complete
MKQELIMENWRSYLKEQRETSLLVEKIWSGHYTQESILLEDQQHLLEESVRSFFSGAWNSVKNKVEGFKEWTAQKLMAFIDNAIQKVQGWFGKMRVLAKKLGSEILLKLFPKNGTRSIVGSLSVFRREKYLRAGAAIMATILAKLAELGAQTLLDTLTAGAGTAAKVSIWIKENLEKLKLVIETIKNSLDPNGIADMLENIALFKDAAELITDLKADLQDPFKDLRSLET